MLTTELRNQVDSIWNAFWTRQGNGFGSLTI